MADVSNINLINKTLDVVELLASEPREMGVSEISRRLKMVKSGTYRILNSLKEREYVYQNPINKLYGLGLKFYFIGSSVQVRLPLGKAGKEVLDPLSSEYNECFQLAIPYYVAGKEPTHILVYVSAATERVLSISLSAGLIAPSHTSAIGQCILSQMSDSELETYKESSLSDFTDRTITSWCELEEELNKIRDQGYAICDGAYELGLMDIAVPVFDSMHCSIGAIAVCGPTERLSKIELKGLIRKMKKASAKIAAKL
ncbi:IclR family transcriptional regulator [uncultured Succinatimonas sp.]|uniref:IclR family transcriptional regulator n=1 Tax=uncultured Succinatimonas sp. TaxID=1262973 RepID=UPI0025E72287|nr:IclR family transcriptional regulator [uncultured Succinatimonas sp.]